MIGYCRLFSVFEGFSCKIGDPYVFSHVSPCVHVLRENSTWNKWLSPRIILFNQFECSTSEFVSLNFQFISSLTPLVIVYHAVRKIEIKATTFLQVSPLKYYNFLVLKMTFRSASVPVFCSYKISKVATRGVLQKKVF